MADDVKEQISQLETRRFRAMCEADFATVDSLLADSLIYTHSSATVDSKKSYMEGLRTRFQFKRVERSGEEIRVHGDCAIVTGEAVMDVVVAGVARTMRNRYIDVWAKTPRGWQMVAWQSTPVPPKNA
jgi:ketosteroid isomerase-like protein